MRKYSNFCKSGRQHIDDANAFINALQPAIDRQINLAAVGKEQQVEKKGFLEKVFDGKDENKKDRNEANGRKKMKDE